jgi:hypothetical protein
LVRLKKWNFLHGSATLVGRGLLIVEISVSHSDRRKTLGRTPRNKLSSRRGDFYLTTYNTHKRQNCIPPVGFEPAIPGSERPQTHALDCADNEICKEVQITVSNLVIISVNICVKNKYHLR